MSHITGLVLTLNSERLLGKCLESMNFCDRIVVVDSFSTDATETIARSAGCIFVQHKWHGLLKQYEFAFDLLKGMDTEWVFSLDSDEICSDELRSSILAALRTDENRQTAASLAGYWIPRRSWYYDHFLTHSGWYPDYLLRLFKISSMYMGNSGAHTTFNPDGPTAKLQGDILHYPYSNFREHLDKINSYAQQGADDMAAKGRKGGILPGLLHGFGRFLRIYVLKRGFLDGRAGFINAAHGAFYAFLKYVRINEGNWGFPYNHREQR